MTSCYLVHWYNEANTEIHTREADLFNLMSLIAHKNVTRMFY